MISLVSFTALLAIGKSQSATCDTATPPAIETVVAGGTADVDLLVSENGLFFLSGCDDTTTTDFSLQIFEDDGVNPPTEFGDPCPGTAACMAGEGCFVEFTGILPPPNFEGFIRITNPTGTDGNVQLTVACAQTTTMAPMMSTEMSTTEMLSTTDSPDSSESTDSTDSTDSPESIESSDSPSDDNAESLSGESSEESVSANGELIEEESPEEGEADVNGRSAELNAAAAGQAADESMPFWQWVWIIVAVFVLLNFGLCYWLYTLKQAKKRPRVSFDATSHADLQIEME